MSFLLMAPTVSTSRLSDSVREGERLKGQIEERDHEVALLMRRLEVRGSLHGARLSHITCSMTSNTNRP